MKRESSCCRKKLVTTRSFSISTHCSKICDRKNIVTINSRRLISLAKKKIEKIAKIAKTKEMKTMRIILSTIMIATKDVKNVIKKMIAKIARMTTSQNLKTTISLRNLNSTIARIAKRITSTNHVLMRIWNARIAKLSIMNENFVSHS